jgi:hypothetical protein
MLEELTCNHVQPPKPVNGPTKVNTKQKSKRILSEQDVHPQTNSTVKKVLIIHDQARQPVRRRRPSAPADTGKDNL